MHGKVESCKARTGCFSAIRASTISGGSSDFVSLFAIVNNIICPILFVSLSLSLFPSPSLVRQDVLRRKTAGSRSDPQSMIKINHFLCITCVCVPVCFSVCISRLAF